MQSVITRSECSNLLDQFMNSELGKRITTEQQSKYTPDSNGEYDERYWDELNERHVQALNCFIEHLVDIHKPFLDQLS